MPGIPLAAGGDRAAARAVARRAWRGLIQVLAGPDAAAAWWHPPWRRRAAASAGPTTLALFVVNLAASHRSSCAANPVPGSSATPGAAAAGRGGGGAAAAGGPVSDAGLADRVARAAAGPAGTRAWRGGWPWGPAQMLALLGAFCVAGVRQRRPVLWWMWALSLIPWWLWLAADVPDLNGPASATIVFTAAAIAVDSIGSRLARPAGPGRPDRARRAGAGPAGRAGGAHPDRAGTA